MMHRKPVDIPASIHRRLMNLSRESREDFNAVLVRYGLERLLYRLSKSRFASDFVLKGAMLYSVWTAEAHRPTRDMDLLGYGDNSAERLSEVFQEICGADVEPDGLMFDENAVRVEEIRDQQEYQGQRIRIVAHLGNARIPIQVDVGFGDVVTPGVQEIEYPTLLDQPSPKILVYPRETVVSEKLQAMVVLGMPNSRMKDYYDIWMISKTFPFDGGVFARAIRATFERRRTPIPQTLPTALGDEFAVDSEKGRQWKAFLTRNRLMAQDVELEPIIEELRLFLVPPLRAAAGGDLFEQRWKPGGPWSRPGI